MSSVMIWNIKATSPLASELAKRTGVTPFLAQLLVNRGISDEATAELFLNPRLIDLPDPMLLTDMDKAISTVLWAMERGWKITVFGDYDADGITSTSLLVRFLSRIGANVDFYIPDRLNEGYGLNKKAVQKIHAGGSRLIITVDCGVSNSLEIAMAKDLGMEVVVTDHHILPHDFSAFCPVINPNRKGSLFPFRPLAGVGVAFFLTVALRSVLRKKGTFKKIPEPDLREYLDLVAIGTIADRVPMVGLNRTLVRSGLKVIPGTRWPGIKAMIDAAGIENSGITCDDIAFRLAPRLNAPGRIGDARMGMDILGTEDISHGRELALEINSINTHRQALEREILDEARTMLNEMGELPNHRTFVLASEKWHKGVMGIVASKLVDEYNRPVLLFSVQNGRAVGSGRSIKGFDLYGALARIGHLFEKYGGHSRAAGLTMSYDNLGKLKQGLESLAGEIMGDDDFIPTLDIDAEVSAGDIGFEIIRQINELAPFGEGNPEPVLLARSMEVLGSRVVGDNHMKMQVSAEGRTFESIGFGMGERTPETGAFLDIAFVPEINRWGGYDSVQLRIVDFLVHQ